MVRGRLRLFVRPIFVRPIVRRDSILALGENPGFSGNDVGYNGMSEGF